MAIRLLVAMLMLVGPLPRRICTCAAVEAHEQSESASADLPDDDGHCGHSHGPGHSPDCPAVNAQSAAPEAISTSAPVVPSDPVWPASSPIPTIFHFDGTPFVPAAPSVIARQLPLYITFVSLRN